MTTSRDEPPLLPDVTSDETPEAWGEDADDAVARLLAERPPHHLDRD